MTIGALQRFTLIDYPGQLAAVVFTQGCNFRCSYCHNPELVNSELFKDPVPENEVFDFLKARKGILSAVVISGGEPTIHIDLPIFAKNIKDMGFLLKLDTNGTNPDMIRDLIKSNLVDYWAMDIKAPLNLYSEITNVETEISNIEQSMNLIRSSGKDFEFRCTVYEPIINADALSEIKTMLKPHDKFYIQKCRYEQCLYPLSNDPLAENLDFEELMDWGAERNIYICSSRA